MPRLARTVLAGLPHHITRRGNKRQNIFLVDEDRQFDIEALRAICRQDGLILVAGGLW